MLALEVLSKINILLHRFSSGPYLFDRKLGPENLSSLLVNMKKDSIYKYRRTGNLYRILSSDCKMKNPVTREWTQAVILENNKYINDSECKIWVRELQEFNEKFKLWN